MYGLTDLKKDTLIQLGGVPYRVVEYQHTQLGRGGAVVKTKIKNLLDGSVISQTFKGNDKVEPAEVRKLNMQYLYQDDQSAHFMDVKSYEQLAAPLANIKDQLAYLAEGTQVVALKFQDQIVGVELPAKVELEVTHTENAVRGDTTGTALKPATLGNGTQVRVPLFVKTGDRILVDTRDGSYVGRA